MQTGPEARGGWRQQDKGLLFSDSLTIRSFSKVLKESRYILQDPVVKNLNDT